MNTLDRGRRFILISLVLACPVGVCAQTDVCTDANERFRQRQWSEAATGFAACEQRSPGKTDALLFRGKSLVNLRRFDDAEVALQSYSHSHPESDDAIYLLAYISFRKGKPQDSLRLFSRAAQLKSPTANDLTIAALDYVLLNDYNDAAHYLELSLKMNPADVEARYHLGRVRYQQNQFDLAMEAFQEVLRRDPNNEKAEDNLGLSLEAKNQVEEAIAAYQKAIELDQKSEAHSEQPYLNLGSLLAQSNRLEESLPWLARAAEIAPAAFQTHYELAKAYLNCNRFELARIQAEQAVKLNPNDSSGHYLLGRVYQHLGQKDRAQEQFRWTDQLLHEKELGPQGGMASRADSP
jgi:tetratricopeptide (TPR) repeat protein